MVGNQHHILHVVQSQRHKLAVGRHLLHLLADLRMADHQFKFLQLLRFHESLASLDDRLQRHRYLLLEGAGYHALRLVFGFDLLVEHSESHISKESQGVALAIESGVLVHYVDQNMVV